MWKHIEECEQLRNVGNNYNDDAVLHQVNKNAIYIT